VYEFDLKGFFDNVPLELIDTILKEEYGMPLKFRNRILKLNLSQPKLTTCDKMYEPSRLNKFEREFLLANDRINQ
jgi:hypothetical protein